MALFRSLETRRPVEERLFADPLADAFLRPWARALLVLARLTSVRHVIERVVDRNWPGARTSAIARTRLFDDAVLRAVREGVRQLVLLGAGFDSRAYRLRIGDVRVFEVDQPATQARKIARIERRFGSPPEHVIHIPVDFQTQTIDAALRANG